MSRLGVQQRFDPAQFQVAEPIADQQHVAACNSAVLEQLQGQPERAIGACALRRHQPGFEIRQKCQDRVHVAGQRRNRKGIRRIDDECGLTFVSQVQNICNLVPRARQAARLDIGGIHRA